MADSSQNTPSSSAGPIYHEITPNLILGMRIAGIVTIAMVVLSFIFCLVQGNHNRTLYLLACNLIISSFVGIVTVWWYRSGDLTSDKYWFMIIVAMVIIFQCITTDIFVFNYEETLDPTYSTTTPPTTHTTSHTTSTTTKPHL